MLARSPATRSKLGTNARRRAERYSFETEWAAYRLIYAGEAAA